MEKIYKINEKGMAMVYKLESILRFMTHKGFYTTYTSLNTPHLYISGGGNLFFNMTQSQRYYGQCLLRMEVPNRYLVEVGDTKKANAGECLSTIKSMGYKTPKNEIETMMDRQIKKFIEEIK